MPGDIDIVIESPGSNAFRPFSTSGIDTSFYDRAKQIRNLNRTLHSIRCGNTGGEINPLIKEMVAEVEKLTGGNLKRIGALCLYGTSNGSGFILGLAKALQARGAPSATYVGLGDLTLMPFKRDPPIDLIGNLQPINRPEISMGLRVTNPGLGHGLPPNITAGRPPRIADPGVVGDTLENYFTIQGNRARVTGNSPFGTGWWWFSTQKFGEVHGEIEGKWINHERMTTSSGSILVTGPGSVDEGHHDDLCGKAILEMHGAAGLALGKFITKNF